LIDEPTIEAITQDKILTFKYIPVYPALLIAIMAFNEIANWVARVRARE
jgi:hypothetical protein